MLDREPDRLVGDLHEAMEAVRELGFPVFVRAHGSTMADDIRVSAPMALADAVSESRLLSPGGQVAIWAIDSSEPCSMEDYERLTFQNLRVTGRLSDVTQHMPCPFCAAPEWHVVLLREFEKSTEPIMCAHCRRSARLVFSRESSREGSGLVTMTIVQTGGPDPPQWLEPKPERQDSQ